MINPPVGSVSAELLAWAMARAIGNGATFRITDGKIWTNDPDLIHFAQLTIDALTAHYLTENPRA